MYCRKCGNSLKDGADRCDVCGEIQIFSKEKKTMDGLAKLIIAISVFVCSLAILIMALAFLFSTKKNTGTVIVKENSVTEVSVDDEAQISDVKDAQIVDNEMPAKTEVSENTSVESSNKSDTGTVSEVKDADASTLILPSLESFSKGRLTAGDYVEDMLYGCYLVEFVAENGDSQIIQCMGEYQSTLAKYGANLTGTTSFEDDNGYHCTAYTFSYFGDKVISKDSVEADYGGVCDFCFVSASKDDNAKIIAYIPANVIFEVTRDKINNSY